VLWVGDTTTVGAHRTHVAVHHASNTNWFRINTAQDVTLYEDARFVIRASTPIAC
jgi:hypothetical protein